MELLVFGHAGSRVLVFPTSMGRFYEFEDRGLAAFLPGLHDETSLQLLRSMDIVIVTGSKDPHVEEARQLSRVLWEKQVPNTLDVWDGWMHDWPYWQAMVTKYL
jgi:esterase/lipase superfamily enzyme